MVPTSQGHVVTAAAMLAVAFSAGAVWHGPPPATASKSEPAPKPRVMAQAPTIVRTTEVDPVALAEVVRTVVREELAAVPSAGREPIALASDEESLAAHHTTEAKPTLGQLEQMEVQRDRADETIDGALASGRWTKADAEAVHEAAGKLESEEVDAYHLALMQAVTSGELEVEFDGPLF